MKSFIIGQQVWYIDSYNKPKLGRICYICSRNKYDQCETDEYSEVFVFNVHSNKSDKNSMLSGWLTTANIYHDKQACITAIIKNLLEE